MIIMRPDGTGPGDRAAVLSKFSLDGQAEVWHSENRKRESFAPEGVVRFVIPAERPGPYRKKRDFCRLVRQKCRFCRFRMKSC